MDGPKWICPNCGALNDQEDVVCWYCEGLQKYEKEYSGKKKKMKMSETSCGDCRTYEGHIKWRCPECGAYYCTECHEMNEGKCLHCAPILEEIKK